MHEIQLKTLNVCSFQTRYVCICKHNFLFCTSTLFIMFRLFVFFIYSQTLLCLACDGGGGCGGMGCALLFNCKRRSQRKVKERNDEGSVSVTDDLNDIHVIHHVKWMHFATAKHKHASIHLLFQTFWHLLHCWCHHSQWSNRSSAPFKNRLMHFNLPFNKI